MLQNIVIGNIQINTKKNNERRKNDKYMVVIELIYRALIIYFTIGIIWDFVGLIYRALKRGKRGK